jgi:hypothetical protein
LPLGPTCRPPHFRPGLPVGGRWARRRHAPIESSAPCAFKNAAILTGPVRRRHLVSMVSVAAPLRVGRRRSSLPPCTSVTLHHEQPTARLHLLLPSTTMQPRQSRLCRSLYCTCPRLCCRRRPQLPFRANQFPVH